MLPTRALIRLDEEACEIANEFSTADHTGESIWAYDWKRRRLQTLERLEKHGTRGGTIEASPRFGRY